MEKKTFSMVDANEYPHDSNLTLTCLLRALYETARDNRLTSTQTLYVQADNCGRENKNRFFLSIMAVLVARGIVKEIIVSFLMVDIHMKVNKHLNTNNKQNNINTMGYPEQYRIIDNMTAS